MQSAETEVLFHLLCVGSFFIVSLEARNNFEVSNEIRKNRDRRSRM